MMCLFLTIALVLQGMFHNGGWVEINLQNKEEDKVLFCIPHRYYESHTDTNGHGTLIGYDLVGLATHIVYARTYNAELEIEDWTANYQIITDSKIVRKGIREGMYWRSDAFLKESGEILFTLYGYGKDSLAINHIMDSAHIDRANERADNLLILKCHDYYKGEKLIHLSEYIIQNQSQENIISRIDYKSIFKENSDDPDMKSLSRFFVFSPYLIPFRDSQSLFPNCLLTVACPSLRYFPSHRAPWPATSYRYSYGDVRCCRSQRRRRWPQ